MKPYDVNQPGNKQSISIQSTLDGSSPDALVISFPTSASEDEGTQP